MSWKYKNFMKLTKKITLKVWFYLSLSLLLPSCITHKNQLYFQGISDTTYNISSYQPEPIFQRGDLLSIMIFSLDPEASMFFNSPMIGNMSGIGNNSSSAIQNNAMSGNRQMGGNQAVGYLIDENGEITFPQLGQINILGFTQTSLRDSLKVWLLPYLKDPMVNVRLQNFRVTVITPDKSKTITIPNNKSTILQLLGMVDGIDWLDRRDKILVIREVGNVREILHVDLTNTSIFNSKCYYLQPNDIVYIEPHKKRYFDTNIQIVSSLTTMVASTVSLLFLLINSLN